MKLLNIIFLFQNIFTLVTSFTQGLNCKQDYTGKEFLLVLPQTDNGKNPEIFLYAATYARNTNITFYADGFSPTVVILSANKALRLPVPDELLLSNTSNVENKCIHIVSNRDIVIFVFTESKCACSGFLLYPLNTLGNHYFILAPSLNSLFTFSHHLPNSSDNSTSMIFVASAMNTEVKFVMPRFTSKTINFKGIIYGAGMSWTVRLDSLQGIQIDWTYDFTGLEIFASNPIAVFSGVKIFSKKGNGLSIEQMIPIEAAGNYYAIVPFPNSNAFFIKYITLADNTTIYISSKSEKIYPHAGSVGLEILENNENLIIKSSQPIIIGQYNINLRPAMYLPSIPISSCKGYKFAVPASKNKNLNSNLIIVVDAEYKDYLYLNWNFIPQLKWTEIYGSDPLLVTGSISIAPGTHYLSSPEKKSLYIGYIYGTAEDKSEENPPCCTFSYPIGTCLNTTLGFKILSSTVENELYTTPWIRTTPVVSKEITFTTQSPNIFYTTPYSTLDTLIYIPGTKSLDKYIDLMSTPIRKMLHTNNIVLSNYTTPYRGININTPRNKKDSTNFDFQWFLTTTKPWYFGSTILTSIHAINTPVKAASFIYSYSTPILSNTSKLIISRTAIPIIDSTEAFNKNGFSVINTNF